MPNMKTIELPEGTEEDFITFKINNEKWHAYELEDDTIIKSKFILMEVIAMGGSDEQGQRLTRIGTHNLTVVYSPLNLRGPPDKTWLASELEEYIIDRNLKFAQIEDGGIYSYETENSTIEVDYRVYQVDKTSKFDAKGNPAYIIRTKAMIPSAKEEKG